MFDEHNQSHALRAEFNFVSVGLVNVGDFGAVVECAIFYEIVHAVFDCFGDCATDFHFAHAVRLVNIEHSESRAEMAQRVIVWNFFIEARPMTVNEFA